MAKIIILFIITTEPFGKQVKAKRNEDGLSQLEFSKKCDISPKTLRKIENHDLTYTASTKSHVAQKLNLKPCGTIIFNI